MPSPEWQKGPSLITSQLFTNCLPPAIEKVRIESEPTGTTPLYQRRTPAGKRVGSGNSKVLKPLNQLHRNSRPPPRRHLRQSSFRPCPSPLPRRRIPFAPSFPISTLFLS